MNLHIEGFYQCENCDIKFEHELWFLICTALSKKELQAFLIILALLKANNNAIIISSKNLLNKIPCIKSGSFVAQTLKVLEKIQIIECFSQYSEENGQLYYDINFKGGKIAEIVESLEQLIIARNITPAANWCDDLKREAEQFSLQSSNHIKSHKKQLKDDFNKIEYNPEVFSLH